MKTTNYGISKQLAEAKFKANQVWNQEGQFWGYDLETILEALPKDIEGDYLAVEFDPSESCVGYNGLHIAFMDKNESLANTAAKLWLKLKKEGLV